MEGVQREQNVILYLQPRLALSHYRYGIIHIVGSPRKEGGSGGTRNWKVEKTYPDITHRFQLPPNPFITSFLLTRHRIPIRDRQYCCCCC